VKTQRLSNKLDFKKFRPFRVNKVVGLVNYQLELLKTMKIHLVFYISLLEKAPKGTLTVPTMLTEINNLETLYNIKEILDSKYVKHKLHYLVK
jgi:hypothetical protein